jgi:hypothetical protein
MEFSNTSTKNGLVQTCEFNLFGDAGFGKISGNVSRLTIFTMLLNEAYSNYAIIALMADNSWKFDDNNFTDFPVGTTDLINGEADYTLNNEQVEIDQVEVMDPTGTIWQAIPEIDERMFAEYQVSESQYNNNVAAFPRAHVKRGNSIIMFPTPNYSVLADAPVGPLPANTVVNGQGGVRVRFKRPTSYFVTADTTKKPGFNRMHHTYLTDWTSAKYSSTRGMTKIANVFAPLVTEWETSKIPKFYRSRSSEAPDKIVPFRRRAPR